MHRHFTTFGAMVLFERLPALETLARAFESRGIVKRLPGTPGGGWRDPFPGVVIPIPGTANGHVLIDLVDRPWPDEVGHPACGEDLLRAGEAEWFGPQVFFPGALQRSMILDCTEETFPRVMARHRGFVRVLLGHRFELGLPDRLVPEGFCPCPNGWCPSPGTAGGSEPAENTPCKDIGVPPNHDAWMESRLMLGICEQLLQLEAAVGYFNPSGEVFFTRFEFNNWWSRYREQEQLPLPLLCGIHDYNRSANKLFAIECVGGAQLGLPDLRVEFDAARFTPLSMCFWLFGGLEYLYRHRPFVTSGHTFPGPEDTVWEVDTRHESTQLPPRRVYSFRLTALRPPKDLEPVEDDAVARVRKKGWATLAPLARKKRIW